MKDDDMMTNTKPYYLSSSWFTIQFSLLTIIMNLSFLGGYDFKVMLGAIGGDVIEEYVADYEEHVTKTGDASKWYVFKTAAERKRCAALIEVLNRYSYWGSDLDEIFRKKEHRDKPFQTDEIVVYNGVPAKLFGVSVNEASILRVAETRCTDDEHYLKLETTQRSVVDGYYGFKLKMCDGGGPHGKCEMRYTKIARLNDDVVYPLKLYLRSIQESNNEAAVGRFYKWVEDKIAEESFSTKN